MTIASRRLVPPIPLTDPRFKYVPSDLTDIRQTFKRVRAEMAKREAGK